MLVDLSRIAPESLYLVLLLSGPALAVSLLVGVVVSLLQAVTQVQEQTLAFVPKLVAVCLVLAATSGLIGGELVRYTEALYGLIPELSR